MIDTVIGLFVLFFGVAAAVYGYLRWRKHNRNQDLWWCFIGIAAILLSVFDYVTRDLLTESPQALAILHLTRLALDVALLVACFVLIFVDNE
jgi:hypothetical protein